MTIRSFVLRQGRLTTGQERAFCEHWPTYGIDVEPQWQLRAATLFGDERDLVLEIGFGNGESLVAMADADRATGFIGIEVHRPGVGHALLQAAAKELDNIRFLRHDADEILRDHIPAESLTRVQIYFPDPWPKARHHKRRLVQAPFVRQLWDKLRTGGEVHCATDWQPYAEAMVEAFATSERAWHNLGTPFVPRPPWRPVTKFERRGQNLGHGVWDLRYQKT